MATTEIVAFRLVLGGVEASSGAAHLLSPALELRHAACSPILPSEFGKKRWYGESYPHCILPGHSLGNSSAYRLIPALSRSEFMGSVRGFAALVCEGKVVARKWVVIVYWGKH